MNNDKRGKEGQQSSSTKKPSNTNTYRHTSIPTHTVVNPRSLVCPGQLSRNVSINPTNALNIRSLKDSSKSSIKPNKFPKSPYNTSAAQSQMQTFQTPKSALVVTPAQGIFEIHLKYLELSTVAIQRIAKQFGNESPSIRVSWKFFSFERSTFPLLNTANETHYQIEASILYKIDINEKFFEYIVSRDLSLELYARGASKEEYLARGELKLHDCFEYPSNELYAYVDLCDADKALVLSNTGIAIVYGTLTLWYRLSCDMEFLGMFLNRVHVYYSASTSNIPDRRTRRKSSLSPFLGGSLQRYSLASRRSLVFNLPDMYDDTGTEESVSSLEPTDSEMDNFREALDLVLSRNKALRTTQSEISNELRDRARWLHEESNWKRTLQEYAILCGGNPAAVEWRQWRDADTANVKLRSYTSQTVIYKPQVIISVEHLFLYKSSPPMVSEKFKQFYVEMCFLYHDGIDMECPFSLPKNQNGGKLVFNFSKSFCIDPSTNREDAEALAEAVKKDGEIKFVIVGEPGSDAPAPVCCEEVSSCSIKLLELVQLEQNFLSESLPLFDLKEKRLKIGYLRVHINGALAMRRCALQMLAPPGYNILE